MPGAGLGAAAGGTIGALTGLGLMAIPGVGPVVAAGWLVSTLAGAAAGAATGGVLGALTQAGVSNDDADVYAEGLRRGGAVVSARVADQDAARLQAVMDRSAVRVSDRAAAYRQVRLDEVRPGIEPIHGRAGEERTIALYVTACVKSHQKRTTCKGAQHVAGLLFRLDW